MSMDLVIPQLVIPAFTLPLYDVLGAVACVFVAYLCYRQWRKMYPRHRWFQRDIPYVCHCGCGCGCDCEN